MQNAERMDRRILHSAFRILHFHRLGVVALILLCMTGFDRRLLDVLEPAASFHNRGLNRRTAQYEAFLHTVETHTPQGAAMAILSPSTDFPYCFFRATYMLPTRRVIPVVPGDSLSPARLREVDFIAAWHTSIPPGFVPVLEDHQGVLAWRSQ